jgi:hypothetical protein
MAYMIATIMKRDKTILSKTSALGIKSLEVVTIDFNGKGGDKMNHSVLKILKDTTADKEDIPKFCNTEMRKELGEGDDPISNIDK